MAFRGTSAPAWLRRTSGARLATRLTRTIVFSGAAVFLLASLLIILTLSSYTSSLARMDARSLLAEVRSYLTLHARELDALVGGFTNSNAFYERAAQHGGDAEIAELDARLADDTVVSSVVWVDADGAVVTEHGAAADVEALLALAKDGRPVSGPATLPSGPAVVAVRPIVGYPAGTPRGVIAVAGPIAGDGLAERGLERIAPGTADDAAAPRGWSELDAPEGYTAAQSRMSDGRYRTRGVLTAVDGSALLVELSRPDPWLSDGRAWFVVLLPLLLGVATVGTSYVLGSMLGRSVDRPLHQFVEYLQDQGYLALQGLRTDEEVLISPDLPDDFARLGNVLTDLMTQLRVNQSELIEAGDQALAAEMAFRKVVEESPEVKILVRSGVVEIANPAAAHFFGLQLGDLVRAEPEGLFSGIQLFDEAGNRLELLSVAREARETPVVARCVTPEQPDRWMELSVAFIDYEGDDYVISARNITEERRLEALRAEVLSLVSHDLRSPLTVVRGYLDILDRPLEDERRKTAVDSARRAAQRMEGLLDDLLHATRAERVFAPKVMRPVDLSTLVEGIATSLAMGAEQDVLTSFEPGVTVLGDPVRLEQAIANLVGNAVKHGPAPGEIRVAVLSRDSRVLVTVEDDGAGIPEDMRETVFERGVRTDASEGTPGLGLGLYIVRVVAEAHGGTAYVDPTDHGTRFVLDLPAMQPELELL